MPNAAAQSSPSRRAPRSIVGGARPAGLVALVVVLWRALGALPLDLDDDRLDVAVRRQRHVDAARLDDLQGVRPARQVNQPVLINVLLHKALFTAKEAAAASAIGAVVGFVLAVVLVHSRLLQRGFLPYIVASQTVPILAIAPMVVVWVEPEAAAGRCRAGARSP